MNDHCKLQYNCRVLTSACTLVLKMFSSRAKKHINISTVVIIRINLFKLSVCFCPPQLRMISTRRIASILSHDATKCFLQMWSTYYPYENLVPHKVPLSFIGLKRADFHQNLALFKCFFRLFLVPVACFTIVTNLKPQFQQKYFY